MGDQMTLRSTLALLGAVIVGVAAVYLAQSNQFDPPTAQSDGALGVANQKELPLPEVGQEIPSGSADASESQARTLVDQANAGSAQAAYALFSLTSRCRGVSTIEDAEELARSQIELGAKPRIRDHLVAKHYQCRRDLAALDPRERDSAQWGALARRLEHPAFVAQQVNSLAYEDDFAEADALALTILESEDPEAIFNIAAFLELRDAATGNPDTEIMGRPSPEVRQVAITLLACARGWAGCRGESDLLWATCGMRTSPCDPSENLADVFSRIGWTPLERELGTELFHRYSRALDRGNVQAILGPPMGAGSEDLGQGDE